MLRSRPTVLESILLMVDERRDAEEIAVELRRKGHQVDVREVTLPLTADYSTRVNPLRDSRD
jgi:hypothetical protein